MPTIRAGICFALAAGLAACGSSSADLPSSEPPGLPTSAVCPEAVHLLVTRLPVASDAGKVGAPSGAQ